MQLNTLQRASARTYEKRVGRGGSRGKTSGRGTKGQKARAGHRIMPAIREVLKKLPKNRGYRFKSIKDKPEVVNVAVLERYFSAGDKVDPTVLALRGLVRRNTTTVKVLGDGALTKKLSISGCSVSAAARAKVEQVGGSVQ